MELTVPSSLVVMVPSPSLSKRENASLNSAICSSVNWSACRDKLWLGKDKKIKRKRVSQKKGRELLTLTSMRGNWYIESLWKCENYVLGTIWSPAFVLLLIFFSKIVRSGAREMNYGDCRSHENQTGGDIASDLYRLSCLDIWFSTFFRR